MTWLTNNWGTIVAFVGALHVLLGVVNRLVPAQTKNAVWWRWLLDRTGAFSQPGMQGAMGWYSPPGYGSVKVVPVKKNTKLNMFLPLVFFGLVASSCASIPASVKQYASAFGSCMDDKGLSVAPSVGYSAFNILDGGGSTSSMTSALEGLFSSTGLGALKDALVCAVSTWQNVHPVATNASPTPSQVAARVFMARRGVGR